MVISRCRHILAGGLALAAGVWAPAAWAKTTVDVILHNGKILTVDKNFTAGQAIAIKGDRVVAVGPESLLSTYSAPLVIDLKGRVAMPGFMDTHLHPSSASRRSVDAAGAKSIGELQAMVAAKAKELGPGEWITGHGWAEANLAEKRNVLRADLDTVAPNNPVALSRAGGHSIVGNSLALKAAGIDRYTPNPERGVIEHDAQGEPNGIIRERTNLLVSLFPKDTPAELRQGYIDNLQGLTHLGITSLIIASASIGDEVAEKLRPEMPKTELTYKQLRSMYAEHGPMLPRASVEISYPGAAALKAYPYKTGYGDLRLKLGAIGEAPAVDGGFTGPTAWTSQDYVGQPGFKGQPFFNDEADLRSVTEDVAANGWQLGLHTIGDAAIDMAAKIYGETLGKYKRTGARWYLAHFTMLPSDATMATMVRHGILAAAQPNFLYTLENRYVETLDGKRLEHNNPVAVPEAKGVFLAFGSDNLPIDPRVGLYAAVTRKGISGRVFGQEEAVSIQQAIRDYTAAGPYLTFEEKEKGTLEPGKLADLIVLDRDPTAVPAEQLLTMQVDLTMIGGKVVYDRAALAAK
ncbi:amidohydrolase [Sphingobium nicotianae]|uniref:Amidohydrolase n=1 Tax=Sphingobium nicotianae TaxID=2782607 RepID=A0A9X1DBE7_9SPHN|nr:amidohydrolase [Sphingobium nicotianae]MBT2186800.1 amidohydrolase [Sphingobium nicotianae]